MTVQTLVLAFNYGGRGELARGARRLAELVQQGKIRPCDIDADALASQLDTADFPDPDLLIRTGGEQRLSNFLPFQSAYSELVFTDCLWPDFDIGELRKAVAIYLQRERRFGGVPDAIPQAASA